MDWEFDILYAIQSIRTPFLDKVMAFLSTLGNAGALWIVIGVVLCISKKYRRGGSSSCECKGQNRDCSCYKEIYPYD